MQTPRIVDAATWQRERDALLVEEKRLTHELDALAARRRRLPMVAFSNYTFQGPRGAVTLLDLFAGRTQLVIYQFMNLGPGKFCPGCTGFTNNIPERSLQYIEKADASWANTSDMPIDQIEPYKKERGWTIPFVSSAGTTFSTDTGQSKGFMLSVWMRDGEAIYRTYATTRRGVDRLLFSSNIRDLLPYGRQEAWEDSPPGWPQHPTYG